MDNLNESSVIETEQTSFSSEKEPAQGAMHSESRKSGGLAAFLSALFIGTGFFYIGNYIKAFIYILVFATLIVLVSTSHHDMGGLVFGLLLAGFYVFQIFDSYNEAEKLNRGEISASDWSRTTSVTGCCAESGPSLFGSVLILIVGILFLIRNLGWFSIENIIRLWPLVLIGAGIKIIYEHIRKQGGNNEQE